MRKVKTYQQFVNEENIFRNVAIGTALGASLLGGSPEVKGQEVDKEEITGKYGVNAIEDATGVEIKDYEKDYFEDLVYRVTEIAENAKTPLKKSYSVEKVEHLKEWQQYRVILKENNVSPGQNPNHEIYIPETDFQEFLDNGDVSEHILNTFMVLENPDDTQFLQKSKRRKDTYYLPGYKL